MVLLILDPDDLGLDRWSRVCHGGRVGLIVEVRLIRRRKMLPWMERQVLPWPFVLLKGVVHSLRKVLLWFPVARVMCNWVGM